jgi:hypothetical protein
LWPGATLDVDFVISEADMDVLKNVERIKDYGNASMSRFMVEN